MPRSASRLGKGLSALVTPRTTTSLRTVPLQPSDPAANAVRDLPLQKVKPNPKQPRNRFGDTGLQELAASVRANGVLQPILVRPATGDTFEIIAGERRWRAARIAELKTIPAIIHQADDSQSLELALVENLQREDLAPLDRATAYRRYLDTFGVSVDDLAKRLSESRANIANYLRLLKLTPRVREMLEKSALGMGQARAIAGVTDPERQLALAKLAYRRNLSVRQVEALAGKPIPTAKESPQPPTGGDRHRQELEDALASSLGMKVTLKPGKRKNSGRVVIHYNSLEEFDALAQKLGGTSTME